MDGMEDNNDIRELIPGWDGGIRTPECQDQNLVPYHLATSQCGQE